ncbi:BEL1-like homeodomain protein 6 [Ricinus communis]|uniref:Bel1 homeotic protein, putative n=1 Tax=Ricinus communis TaxID=3988 RepID=B9RH96_RICCO|nr:BEL1-like homeodomain protein 6 [Ricinus communis]XP_015570902.1 BEL1-like homeodomain protein 6 [Ricinus communis]XP_048233632.1 BEL1-like homeodomain protein 6 [Ricinus communis]EEF49458.1 bel1 homeotic protein, putative [Ricinus communis]|eukprot:XP_002512955.1 BEL1-like homeodomain protein 6 [Ricinus communis]
MATYYASTNNQREAVPMIYMPGSYSEAPVLPGNVMMYMNAGSYSDTLAGNSQQQNNCIEIQSVEASDSTPQQQEILSNLSGSRMGQHDLNAWRDGRNEMLVMHSMAGPSSILLSGQNLQGQGLSLSLGTQIPSGIQMPSISYRNPSPGLASFLSPTPSIMGEGGGRNSSSRDEEPKHAEYLPPGFSGGNQDSNKGALSPYGITSVARTIPSSKYLKAAQQLLDEVVSVRKALKQPDKEKNQNRDEHGMNSSNEGDGKSKDGSSNPQESTNNSPNELSHGERQELQNKLTKLLSMLDEVDRRYKQYYHQMQIVVSSFDVIAGCGAAKPYTALALQTISRHFRCLLDAISGQIRATRKSLGEQETSENGKGVGITRLRYVDQQLRQQRALQQLGMMQQHAWRPQRGLPESSVSILRAWLFEHFLHPYPKDSDKIMLARQTGLTRSQVSNWFINARVRLWKPMVEEMYKEEIGDVEMDSNSSSENAARVTKGDMGTSEDREEEMQQSASSVATERCSAGPLMDSKSVHASDVEMAGSTTRSNFHNIMRGEAITDYGLLRLREEQRPSMDDCGLFPDAIVHSDGGGNRFMAAAAAAYQMSEVARFGSGSGVSLTLGLQHCDDGSLPMSATTHHSFVPMRGDDIYGAAASSVGAETTDFDCLNPGNREHRFSSSHLLHDFVA